MENEGFQGQKHAEKVIKFPKPELLPSQKIEQFTPDIPFDMQSLDFLLWLPKGRSGFRFKTEQSLTKGPQKHDNTTSDAIRQKTQDQMRFTQGNLAKEALDKYRKNPTEANKIAYEAARQNYLERSNPKVGLRNIRISGDTVTVDTKPVDFQVNAVLGTLDNSTDKLGFGVMSSTSGNVVFAADKDGKKKLGLMLRGSTNGNWRKVPGTLIAGYFDGKLDEKPSKLSPKQGRRTLQKIDNTSIIGNGLKELQEEIGLEPKDIKQSIIAGIAIEKKNRVHAEILVDVESKLTAEQAREKSSKHEVHNTEEFPEDWVAIDYTPEAITTLLTEVQCPLPDSHYASFSATGRRLVAELKGEKAASEWVRMIEVKIAENKERINSTVRQYLRNNPDVMTKPTADQQMKVDKKLAEYVKKNPNATEEEKAKFKEALISELPKFNPDGFNPALLPEEQGLPDIMTALRQSGLIKDESKIVQFTPKE